MKKICRAAKISSRAISTLIMENTNDANSHKNIFAYQAYKFVFDNDNNYNDNFLIKRINKWAKIVAKDSALNSDILKYKEGETVKDLGPLTIKKINNRKARRYEYKDEQYLNYIATDCFGWKYWFRIYAWNQDLDLGLINFPQKGQKITFKYALIRQHKTGITFLASNNFYKIEE